MKISVKSLCDDNLDSHKKSKNNYLNTYVVIKFEDLNQQDKILSCNKKHTIIMHSLKELHSQTWSKNGRQRWAIMFSRPFFVAMQRLCNPCHAEPQNEQWCLL